MREARKRRDAITRFDTTVVVCNGTRRNLTGAEWGKHGDDATTSRTQKIPRAVKKYINKARTTLKVSIETIVK